MVSLLQRDAEAEFRALLQTIDRNEVQLDQLEIGNIYDVAAVAFWVYPRTEESIYDSLIFRSLTLLNITYNLFGDPSCYNAHFRDNKNGNEYRFLNCTVRSSGYPEYGYPRFFGQKTLSSVFSKKAKNVALRKMYENKTGQSAQPGDGPANILRRMLNLPQPRENLSRSHKSRKSRKTRRSRK